MGKSMQDVPCAIEDCERLYYGKGLCAIHYSQARRNGEHGTGECVAPECERAVYARGRCGLHYSRWRNGDLSEDGPRRRGNGEASRRNEDGNRQCGRCLEWKSDVDYHSKAVEHGVSSICKRCVRDLGSLRKWGLTPAQVEEIARDQGGCAICKTQEPGGKGWCVDHDHACCPGQGSCGSCMRDILCPQCNSGIGLLGDDQGRLIAAANYLGKWKQVLS